MVNFRELQKSRDKPRSPIPREIFNALPRPPGINDLYASQAEVLEMWFRRRNEKDLVVKLHTGGGKTLVALLMAQSVMNEHNEPVLYLAPTNQLVRQVLNHGAEYGISVLRYTKGEPLPAEFLDGASVLVGAYETLFNGRSKFGVRGSSWPSVRTGAIILDDAHVALSSVRQAFTLTINSNDHTDLYNDLADSYRSAFKQIGRSGTFADIVTGKDYGVIEVPSWAWHQTVADVQRRLVSNVDDINPFVWPLLRDNLAFCHCLFGRDDVTITPIFPPVDLLPTFADCPRRIYMSATIADDSEIIRTFGASPKSVAQPITSTSLAGVGERLILIPALMDIGDQPIKPKIKHMATELAGSNRGVTILTPSRADAETWTDVAVLPKSTDEVAEHVSALRNATSYGPIVLANRYDGIDLPGDACRFLIIDGLPVGTGNYDIFRMNVMPDAAVNSLLAQRIEQGMGRGSRGGGDYCAVILLGTKLVGWIGRRSNLSQLTASTRVQLRMGQDVSQAVTSINDFAETIVKCLRRDPDWVAYHASELADAAHNTPVDKLAIRVAGSERRAFRQQRLGQPEEALATLEKLRSDTKLEVDPQRQAWLAASGARIAYQMDDEDRGRKLQTKAFIGNNNHSPPQVRPKYVARPKPSRQSKTIVSRLLEFDRPGSLVATFDEDTVDLVAEASARRFENSLAQLGLHLGFDAEQPERVFGVGPDVLWRTDRSFDFIIEAKNRKEPGNPLYKNEHAQLLQAEHWFKENYPARSTIRVSALPAAVADRKATPKGTLALRLSDLSRMAVALRDVLKTLAASTTAVDALEEQCEVALRQASLTPESIIKAYMVPFENIT